VFAQDIVPSIVSVVERVVVQVWITAGTSVTGKSMATTFDHSEPVSL
jgi:hypothetical protein